MATRKDEMTPEDDINGGEYLAQDDEFSGDYPRLTTERRRMLLRPLTERVQRYVMSSKSMVEVNGPTDVVLTPPRPFMLNQLMIAPAQNLKIAPSWVIFLIRLVSWVCFPWLYREEWDRRRWYITLVYPASRLYNHLFQRAQVKALADCWVESVKVGEIETLAVPKLHATTFIPVQFGSTFSGPPCKPPESITVRLNGTGGYVFVTAIGQMVGP